MRALLGLCFALLLLGACGDDDYGKDFGGVADLSANADLNGRD